MIMDTNLKHCGNIGESHFPKMPQIGKVTPAILELCKSFQIRGQRDIDIDIDDIGHYRYRHRYWVTDDIDIDIFIDKHFLNIFCENHIFLVCCETKLHVKH